MTSLGKSWPQCLVAILSNFVILAFGLQVGWLSPLQPALQSENSPLGQGVAPLTEEEISWIGALPSIFLTIAAPVFGYWLDRFGRKFSLFLATAPNIFTYLLLLFANDVRIVYAARMLGGFCSMGGFVVTPIYVNEIANEGLRSFLGGLSGCFIKIGIIVSFILGGYTSYLVLNLSSMLVIVVFIVCYPWLPESPYYLVANKRTKEAREALQKLRRDEKEVELELRNIETILGNSNENNSESKSALRNLFTTRANLMGLFIICAVYTVQMLSGYPAIMRYTVDIFQDSGVSYSPYLAAIFVAVAQLLASFVGAAILERVGRKSILVVSTAIMGVSMFAMSLALYLDLQSGWLKFLPTVSLVIFVGGYAAGYGTAPFVLFPELFALDVRGAASAISNIWISGLEFVVVKVFLSLNGLVGLAGSIGLCCLICSFGTLFLQLVMFETKGLTFEAIYQILSGRSCHAADGEGKGSTGSETTRLRARDEKARRAAGGEKGEE